ncbi:hypothetical protein [Pseudomonas sp. PS02302]|uniref:hypothetical protein n=1 Tax=Pseudomonas sp. PS02302 TaxID=2991428 RepID=UPI00249AB4C5|nr:hypothetical protein [Pseudomonas sp. PS02302]
MPILRQQLMQGGSFIAEKVNEVPGIPQLARLEQLLLAVEGVYVFVVVGMADHIGIIHN